MKQFKLSAEEIVQLVPGRGGAIASDRITIEGLPVRFMYREPPDNEFDSGWRFLSGTEDDAYMAEASNHAVFDVNTIANYDRSVLPYLDAPIGSVFEKLPDMQDFAPVDDWSIPED